MKITLSDSHLYHLYVLVFMRQQCKSETEQKVVRRFMRSTEMQSFIDEHTDLGGNVRPVKKGDDKTKEYEIEVAGVDQVGRMLRNSYEAGLPFHVSEKHVELIEIFDELKQKSKEKEAKDKGAGGKDE